VAYDPVKSRQLRQSNPCLPGRPSRRAGPDGGHARWDVLEFLARVVDHIPEPSQQTVRYWGYYANAARGKRRKAPPKAETQSRRRRARTTTSSADVLGSPGRS